MIKEKTKKNYPAEAQGRRERLKKGIRDKAKGIMHKWWNRIGWADGF